MKKAFILIIIAVFLVGCKGSGEMNNTINSSASMSNITANVVSEPDEPVVEEPEPEEPSEDITEIKNAVPSRPDLFAKEVYVSIKEPFAGDKIGIRVKVENIGDISVKDFDYTMAVYKSDGSIMDEEDGVYGEELEKDDIASITEEFRFKSADTYTVRFFVDSGMQIEEKQESNNIINEEILVKEVVVEVGGCTDTDNGLKYEIKGTCKDSGRYMAGMDDFCMTTSMLYELYCSGNTSTCETEEKTCLHGCMDGVCRP